MTSPAPTSPTVTVADTDVSLPIKPVRTVRFTTDEGTWMSLDVSPDGRTMYVSSHAGSYTSENIGACQISAFDRVTGGMTPADLVVLNRDPLANIRNSTDIRYVVKNGEIYDGISLDRVWPAARAFPKPWWVKEQEELQKTRPAGRD